MEALTGEQAVWIARFLKAQGFNWGDVARLGVKLKAASEKEAAKPDDLEGRLPPRLGHVWRLILEKYPLGWEVALVRKLADGSRIFSTENGLVSVPVGENAPPGVRYRLTTTRQPIEILEEIGKVKLEVIDMTDEEGS